MKNPPFVYHRPDSLEGALDLLAGHGDEIQVLAGGQSLLPMMALRLAQPPAILDLSDVPGLDRIDHDDSSESAAGVTIGAMVRHRTAERSEVVAEHVPLLHRALPHVGHRAIRTRGTVCGSIAHADPASEIPAVALAAGASIVAVSARGRREIDAADFFLGYLETALEPDELVAAVRFPRWPTMAGCSLEEVSRRHGDYAMVGLACALGVRDGVIRDVALAFFGAAAKPVRAATAEEGLIGSIPSTEAFERASAHVADELQPTADGQASASYRRHIASVLTRRCLANALTEIGAPS